MAQESIFAFFDYKRYLETSLKAKPRSGRGQLSALAKHMDMTSAQMSHVMRGDRDLSFEQALRATKFLGLNQTESQFFIEMVMYARASTNDLREFSKSRLESLKAEGLKLRHQIPQHRELSDSEKARFYSSWIYSAVRLLSSVKPIAIEDVIETYKIGRRQASEVLNFLIESGLCVQDPRGITMGARTTFVPKNSPFIFKHHANWRAKALEHAEADEASNLFFTSPVSLSKSDFENLKVRLTELIKDFSATVKDSPEEIVACLDIDWFKVTADEN